MTTSRFTEAVKYLTKSFRAGVALRTALDNTSARYGCLAWSTPEAQRSLLNETVLYTPRFSDCTSQFTFGTTRCARFVRLLMDEIDHLRDADVDESFVECARAFCQSNLSADQDFSYVIFEVPTGTNAIPARNLVVRVSGFFNDLGHRVWEAGLFLCAQLIDAETELQTYFKGRRVLELGAGTGISAAAYVEAGVDYALLTDYDSDVVSNMEHNITINVTPNNSIETNVLNANDVKEVLAVANSNDIDTVVAADVTYDKDLLICMVNAFEHALVGKRIGLLVVTHRSETTTTLLKSELSERRLSMQQITCRSVEKRFDYLAGWDFSRVSIYRVWNEDIQ